MGTFNSNILPTTTGLSLGSATQQWNANLAQVNSSSLNNKVYAQPNESVLSAVNRLLTLNPNGGIVYFDQGVYPSGNIFITNPNIMLVGAGMPGFNASNPTALFGGTIIQGTISVNQGADRFSIRDMGIDVGPNWVNQQNSAVAVDGLAIYNNGQVVGAAPVQSPVIMNVSVLGYNNTVPFHAMLVENVNDAHVLNIATCFNQHGLVIKGTNVNVNGVYARGHGIDSIIVKYDSYAPSKSINISNFNITSIVPGDTKGIYLLGNSSPLFYTNVSNGNITTYTAWGIQCQNCTDVNISNVNIDNASNNTAGVYGLQFTTTTSIVNVSNCNIQNVWAGASSNSPTAGVYQDYNFTNCHFTNITTDALATYGRSNVSDCGFVAVSGNAIRNDSGTTNVVNNYFASVGTTYAGAGTYSFGGSGTMDTSGNITFGANVLAGSGIFGTATTVTINATNTATQISVLVGAQSGLLRFRDNTLGGSAVFLIDPNGGSQLFGTSQITGLSTSTGVTFASGTWKVSLSTGTVPRILGWTIYD